MARQEIKSVIRVMAALLLLAAGCRALTRVDFVDGVADDGSGRVAHLARDLLSEEEVDAVKAELQGMNPDPATLDSTDGLPAYEMYIRHGGQDLSQYPSAAHLPRITERVRAFAADKYGCVDCFVCTVLLRRYQAAERMIVHSHFDRHAYVTAVVSLNPSDFSGGLFLQRTPARDSRAFFSVNGTDAVFHQYDLNHGVEVLNGTRYSAIFWLTDTRASCADSAAPWYRLPAEAGNADAQDALGELHAMGHLGYSRDMLAAAEWSRRAAEQGHYMSQSRLGRMLLSGEGGVPRDKASGVRWVRTAAEQGYPPAQHTMGLACQSVDAPCGLEDAASWFALAAASGIADAQYELGVAYVNGDGLEVNLTAGVHWLWTAAGQGHAEAKSDLEQLRQAGVFEWDDADEAAAQGSAKQEL